MPSKGFTLIELLVVVAIIGILASVVLASLNSARSKGKEAAIKSNLRNMITQVELSYNELGNYSGTCAVVAGMISAITAAGGTAACYSHSAVGDTNVRWGVSAKLNSDTTKNWSVDSSAVVTWEVSDVGGGSMSWNAARTACTSSGGHLPSLEQLKALRDVYAATPPIFDSPTTFQYWSDTTDPTNSTNAYRYNSSSDNVLSVPKTSNTPSVHCVH